MKSILVAILAALPLLSQPATLVELSRASGGPAQSIQIYRDGSGNIEYVCTANAKNKTSTWTRGGATLNLTDIVVTTNTAVATFAAAHGMRVGNFITVAGATVDTDLNGTYALTAVDTLTVTFTTANVTGAPTTYDEPPLSITTTAPRLNDTVWTVIRNFWTGTNLDATQNAVKSGVDAGTPNFTCTSSAVVAAHAYN